MRGGTRQGQGDKTRLLSQKHVTVTQPCIQGRDGGWCACVILNLTCALCPVWFTAHLGLRQEETLGLVTFQPSACPGAGLQGQRERGGSPSSGFLPTHQGVPHRSVLMEMEPFCKDGWGSLATMRLDSSVFSGSRCNEKWPPEPSWSQHC